MVERAKPEVWDAVERVINGRITSREPGTYLYPPPGHQAFEPVLVEGRAIKLHPWYVPLLTPTSTATR